VRLSLRRFFHQQAGYTYPDCPCARRPLRRVAVAYGRVRGRRRRRLGTAPGAVALDHTSSDKHEQGHVFYGTGRFQYDWDPGRRWVHHDAGQLRATITEFDGWKLLRDMWRRVIKPRYGLLNAARAAERRCPDNPACRSLGGRALPPPGLPRASGPAGGRPLQIAASSALRRGSPSVVSACRATRGLQKKYQINRHKRAKPSARRAPRTRYPLTKELGP